MQILNFSPVIGKPSVIAEFDVYLNAGITFHRCKLIVSKKGYKYVSMPSYSVQDGEGNKKFLPFISFSEGKDKEFQRSVLEELKPFLKID